jgi:hypothetical protein
MDRNMTQDTATKAKPAKKAAIESPAPAVKARLIPLGALVDSMWATREEKRALEAEVSKVQARIDEIEEQLIGRMTDQELESVKGTKATVSFGQPTVTAKVVDWEAFLAYIYKNKYGHLLQRRPADPAYRELLALNKVVPGVEPFTKRRLNTKSLA